MRRPVRLPRRGHRLSQVLPRARLRYLLHQATRLRVVVLGDFFLDAYYDCDPRLNEPSIETGLTAYQVVRTRQQAGAAGTVVANLAALGCGHIDTIGFHGDDGNGFELRRALDLLGADTTHLIRTDQRVTPTYGKPCLVEPEGRGGWRVARELERLDVKNRRPTPVALQAELLRRFDSCLPEADAVILVDQVSEANCGVLTTRIRRAAETAAGRRPDTVFLADSREKIAQYRQVSIKPNLSEAQAAIGDTSRGSATSGARSLRQLRSRRTRPCFCTMSTHGMLVCDETGDYHASAFPVTGPTDPVGAGDSTTAALVCMMAGGSSATEAALVANLVASITVQQIGTTGTATPQQVLRRHREIDPT
ncbi:MAG: carbohydrate kinase [Gemmatimonadetes bacterium]|jgi:rfaE bifunctional protein kinase chain/domain|nr:carbohydrate kinase [Gemmatimonadota bacterium]MBT7859740.1 carbohydrate kinase [Gemmatimonadota bacterium]